MVTWMLWLCLFCWKWSTLSALVTFPGSTSSRIATRRFGSMQRVFSPEKHYPPCTHLQATTSITNGNIATTGTEFFYSQKSFDQIGVSAQLQAILASLQITRPSKIQALSFPILSNHTIKACVLGDQTGSGKTLAYLLPMLQGLDLRQPLPAYSPKILILTPTTELALQVHKTIQTIAHRFKLRSSCYISSSDRDSEDKQLRLGLHVLVSTPGKVTELLKRKEIFLQEVQHIVFDEVDVLFMDTTFPLRQIGEALPSDCQYIFTSATLPKEVMQQLQTDFPMLTILKGPGLHRISPTIEEVLIDCSGSNEQQRSLEQVLNNKRQALLTALQAHPQVERTLVFCNTIDQCRRVENFLQRQDRHGTERTLLVHHAGIDAHTRAEHLLAFSKALQAKPSVLVCTDRASRGMDFNRAIVDHVILFDFPAEPSEYIRRVGRTGRAGRAGKATVLVYGRQVEAAKAVIRASIEGKKIDPSKEGYHDEDEAEDEDAARRDGQDGDRRRGSSRHRPSSKSKPGGNNHIKGKQRMSKKR